MPPDRRRILEERTRYEPGDVEPRVFADWRRAGIFHPNPEGDAGENFSIAVPPPNVTGSLHMGHALNAAIQDLCIRVARMRGKRAKWIFGTDHAGIATQRQVESSSSPREPAARRCREAFPSASVSWRAPRIDDPRAFRLSEPRSTTTTSASRGRQLHPRRHARLRPPYEKGLSPATTPRHWDPGAANSHLGLEVEQRTVDDTLYSSTIRSSRGRVR